MFHDISEHPPAPRSRNWSFYFVFFAAVVPVWSSVPLAWVFVPYSLYCSRWLSYSTPARVLFFVSCCEVLFSLYHLHLACRVSGPSSFGAGDLEEIQVAYLRLLKAGLAHLPEDGGDIETILVDRSGSPTEVITQLDHHDPRAVDFRHSIRMWFCKVPWSSIKLLDMQKWVYWSMYNSDLPALDLLPETQRAALDQAIVLLQKRLGCKIEEGSNPNITPMRLTIDDINILWRPLTFYAIVNSINWILRKFYTHRWGFHHGYSNDLEYLLRVPAKWHPATSPRPVLFLHGLGLGLLQYHNTIQNLVNKFPDRPILIPLQPQISQDIFHPHFLKPLSRHQFAGCLAGLLQKLGWVTLCDGEDKQENEVASSLKSGAQKGVTLLSHSNGSYLHAWILKNHPEIVARSCFVDPVTFCSWEGDVCYNFFYRPCMTDMEMIIRYFVGTEIGVVNLLQRHFCWTSNSLWFEEIPHARDPHRTLFILGGKDDIVHSERVKKYLTSHGVLKNLWYDPEGRHGQALLRSGPGLTEVLRWLSEEG
ncbi:hypothetical protein GALMADRAFT_111650 [Galerina marginata CBS 339.88]|uniref:AB hydrolase-1 domain-containing protein n=1 Tax=Galerina marginata (strain CBS 339.88) TaxID=685588 RepID=A0A067TMC0_GALM3|nr:hypothetical protein GALMADRAFT_111650 [Galerina marginata CBS 339.88]